MGATPRPAPGEGIPKAQPRGDETIFADRDGSSDGRGRDSGKSQSASVDTPIPALLEGGCVLNRRFVIQNLLGSGGMGEVYQAEDLELNRAPIALKTIRADHIYRPNMRQRLRQEVLLARSIAHPNVCPVYEFFTSFGPSGEICFLTMKLLTGETLAARLIRSGPLDLEQALHFGREIAAALEAAHEAGVVHRDLKPGNIFLESSLSGIHAIVTDFGLARNWGDELWESDAGRVVGTPAYCAPEVLRGDVATRKSDVYAFGIVVDEMLFGTHPMTPGAFERERSMSEPQKRRIRSVISSCTHADPELRIASPSAAMRAFEIAGAKRGNLLSRRGLLVGAGMAAAGLVTAEWSIREGSDWNDLVRPLPRPRRVALLPENNLGSAKDASLVSGILEQVGSELARAETNEHDLFVVPARLLREHDVQQASGASGLFGANIILNASLQHLGKLVMLTLKLIESATGKPIRNAKVSCPAESLYDLPRLTAECAASLLDIRRKDLSTQISAGGTKNADAYTAYALGREALRKYGQPSVEEAIAQFQKAVDLDPQFARAYASLAAAYAKQYHLTAERAALDLAESNSDKALRLAPDLPQAYSERAMVKSERGQYDAAVSDLMKAIQLDPDDAEAQLILAKTYVASGQAEAAEQAFKKLLEARPNYWVALNDRGLICYRQANYTKAEQFLRQATVAAPWAALPWENLSAVYLETEKFDEAQRTLSRAIGLLPTSASYSNRGTAFFWRGKYREAVADYKRAVDLSPGVYDTWRNLGDGYQLLPGMKAQAKAAWGKAASLAQAALDLNAKNVDVVVDLALLQAKLGNRGKALDLLKNAYAFKTSDADREFREASAEELSGHREKALALLADCVRSGYSKYDITHAPELGALRKDPRFKRLHV